jgi:hypothetical protein
MARGPAWREEEDRCGLVERDARSKEILDWSSGKLGRNGGAPELSRLGPRGPASSRSCGKKVGIFFGLID